MMFSEGAKISTIVTIAVPIAYLLGWLEVRSYFSIFAVEWLIGEIGPIVFLQTGALLSFRFAIFATVGFLACWHFTARVSSFVPSLLLVGAIGITVAIIFPFSLQPEFAGIVKQFLLAIWSLLSGAFLAILYRSKDKKQTNRMIVFTFILTLGTILLPMATGTIDGIRDRSPDTTALPKIVQLKTDSKTSDTYVLLSTEKRIYGVTLPSHGRVVLVSWEQVGALENPMSKRAGKDSK